MGFDATGGKPYNGNQGDMLWYALVAVVVVVCAAAVLLFPTGSSSKKPAAIAQLVAGRSAPEAAGLLNAYGFPDEATSAVLAEIQRQDPKGHAKMMIAMAERAIAGEKRDELVEEIETWSVGYLMANYQHLNRSDPKYMDEALVLFEDGLDLLTKVGGNTCDPKTLQRIANSPDLVKTYSVYDGPVYKWGMRANLWALQAIHSGKTSPRELTTFTENDMKAVQTLAFKMMADPQVQKLLQTQVQTGADLSTPDALIDAADGIDICALGKTIITEVRSFPADTKARMWNSQVDPSVFSTIG